MKIKVGNYILNSDALNFWITEEYETKNGKTDERMVTGYCYTFEKLLETFLQRKIGSSDATTLSELLIVLKSVFEDMMELNKAKFESDTDKLKEMIE